MKPKLEPREVKRIDRARAGETALPPPAEQPGQLSALALGSTSLAVLCGVAAAAGLALVPAFLLALASGVVALFSLVHDLSAPSPRGRASPQSAARCFAFALARGRWPLAHACLHPGALHEPGSRPRLPLLMVEPAEVPVATPERLAAYWAPILGTDAAARRSCTYAHIEDLAAAGARATCRMTLTVERAPPRTWRDVALSIALLGMRWAFFPAPRFRISYRLVLFHQRSQWWLLPPSYEEGSERPAPPGPDDES